MASVLWSHLNRLCLEALKNLVMKKENYKMKSIQIVFKSNNDLDFFCLFWSAESDYMYLKIMDAYVKVIDTPCSKLYFI